MAKEIDNALVERLAGLLDEHGLTEIEYSELTWRIRVSRAATASMAAAMPSAGGPVSVEKQAPTEARDDAAMTAESASGHRGAVTSPMVGTVYVAPEPTAEPFISIGDNVVEGQTLLIVEAMKTMNPIRAPRAGRVTQIFVQNAAPVEYGEVLLIIE